MKNTTAALLLCTALLAGAPEAATAVPAKLNYRCASSVKTIDDAGCSGPWPDKWEIRVQVCAARAGATVYAYAEARWDGPTYPVLDDPTILDGAKLRVQINQAREGTDPVVAERDFTAIESRMENSDPQGDHNGRYRTPTISHRAAPGALGDAALYLDWHGDGHSYQRHEYTGSLTV